MKQIKSGKAWLCLGAVQDLFSRRIVGRADGSPHRSELVVVELEMAVQARDPRYGHDPSLRPRRSVTTT